MSNAYDAYPENSQGVLVLVLGILGLIVCQVLAPVAWIVGNSELRGIDEGRRPPENRGIASAGRILGIIGTVLLGIAVVFGLGFLALVVFGAVSQAPSVS